MNLWKNKNRFYFLFFGVLGVAGTLKYGEFKLSVILISSFSIDALLFISFVRVGINIYKMVIQLYIDYVSQPSRAVLALCIIGKIPFEVKETRIAKMEVILILLSNDRKNI